MFWLFTISIMHYKLTDCATISFVDRITYTSYILVSYFRSTMRCAKRTIGTWRIRCDEIRFVKIPNLVSHEMEQFVVLVALEQKTRQIYEAVEWLWRVHQYTYLRLGHMIRVSDDEITKKPQCYLPHHMLYSNRKAQQLNYTICVWRVSTTNGRRMNSLLLTDGPRLQDKFSFILMRWRMHRLALCADVEKMYRQKKSIETISTYRLDSDAAGRHTTFSVWRHQWQIKRNGQNRVVDSELLDKRKVTASHL